MPPEPFVQQVLREVLVQAPGQAGQLQHVAALPAVLALGTLPGELRQPVRLAGADELGSVTREFLRSRAGTIGSLDVFGGPAAVSDAVMADARAAATAG